jgi:hypothetical protein
MIQGGLRGRQPKAEEEARYRAAEPHATGRQYNTVIRDSIAIRQPVKA